MCTVAGQFKLAGGKMIGKPSRPIIQNSFAFLKLSKER